MTNSDLTSLKGRAATPSSVVRDDILSALFFDLLRTALGDKPSELVELSAEEWYGLYKQVARQSLLGVVFYALRRTAPDIEQRIPKELYLRWFYQAEAIRGLNQTHYDLSKKLTSLFAEQGAASVILKGQANSRLYPDLFVRQTGDIDLWVDGGREQVVDLLSRMGLLEKALFSSHDVFVPKSVLGVDVEIHFDYIQDCSNPIANKRLRQVLSEELSKPIKVPEGFCVPSNKFALLMQLSHIRKHFIGLGVGLRQIMDYYVLLRSVPAAERVEVSELLKPLGLSKIAAAVMWVLSEKLGLDTDYLLCMPDAQRGRILLSEIFADGNFGKFAKRKRGSVYKWWLRNRLRAFRLLRFDFGEMSWCLIKYWVSFPRQIPERIDALRRSRTAKK